MPHDPPNFVVGERIPGTKYVLRGELGKGGMGTVYEVVKEPGIRGAMKVMSPSLASRPDCVARFFAEVRLLAQLRHKNIVDVYDFDRLADGTPFLVMEKLEGETLRSTLWKSARSGQGFPARGAYEVIRQVCEGLYRAHTHATAVVHRDIKPENLFLNQQARSDEVQVKVLDFGVAALVDGKSDQGQLGTPKYMAPEQLRGEPVTPKADLYAAALVLYEMLTGRLPWDARHDTDVPQAHPLFVPIPASRFSPWVPRSVDALIGRALANDPADRPHSVFAFASQLYELQWVDDRRSHAVDVNTTAPTLTALVSLRSGDDGIVLGDGSHDTYRGMTRPPIEGASLETFSCDEAPLPRQTIPTTRPRFSAETIARGLAHPTKNHSARSSVDRSAPTREQIATTRPVPKYDTEPISRPDGGSPATSTPPGAGQRSTTPVNSPEGTPTTGTSLSVVGQAPGAANFVLARRTVQRSAFAMMAILGILLLADVASRATHGTAATSSVPAASSASEAPSILEARTETPSATSIPTALAMPAASGGEPPARVIPTAGAAGSPARSRATPRPTAAKPSASAVDRGANEFWDLPFAKYSPQHP